MNRFDSMAPGVLPARRWLTLLSVFAAAIAATLALTAMLSSPADAAQPDGKGGGGDNSLSDRLDALEAEVTTLTQTVTDQGTKITDLEAVNGEQDGKIAALETRVTALESLDPPADLSANVKELQDTFLNVTRDGNTLTFEGMNVQIVNGTGATDGTKNGLGNLIVGYDKARSSGNDKTGSHYLIVGDEHNYSSFGGIVAGFSNTASGYWASVSGGSSNTASGSNASVSGGSYNTASGSDASVSGGSSNTASNYWASVSGGSNNSANGLTASVSGGSSNTADGPTASVSGGENNTAIDARASVSGGQNNTADGSAASILGGDGATTSVHYACFPACE